MNKKAKIISAALALAILIVALLYVQKIYDGNKFCFNFAHDMAYGDRVVEHPVNQGIVGKGGTMYYPGELIPLQTALRKEGFYIDEYEFTGGGVYLTSFFGPSTKGAVLDFQKKYNLSQTGEVNNETTDKLKSLYGCPTSKTATSTYQVATSSVR